MLTCLNTLSVGGIKRVQKIHTANIGEKMFLRPLFAENPFFSLKKGFFYSIFEFSIFRIRPSYLIKLSETPRVIKIQVQNLQKW